MIGDSISIVVGYNFEVAAALDAKASTMDSHAAIQWTCCELAHGSATQCRASCRFAWLVAPNNLSVTVHSNYFAGRYLVTVLYHGQPYAAQTVQILPALPIKTVALPEVRLQPHLTLVFSNEWCSVVAWYSGWWDGITFLWSVDDAPAGSDSALLATSTRSLLTFVPPARGVYNITLTVASRDGAFTSSSLMVRVWDRPSVACVVQSDAIPVVALTSRVRLAAHLNDADELEDLQPLFLFSVFEPLINQSVPLTAVPQFSSTVTVLSPAVADMHTPTSVVFTVAVRLSAAPRASRVTEYAAFCSFDISPPANATRILHAQATGAETTSSRRTVDPSVALEAAYRVVVVGTVTSDKASAARRALGILTEVFSSLTVPLFSSQLAVAICTLHAATVVLSATAALTAPDANVVAAVLNSITVGRGSYDEHQSLDAIAYGTTALGIASLLETQLTLRPFLEGLYSSWLPGAMALQSNSYAVARDFTVGDRRILTRPIPQQVLPQLDAVLVEVDSYRGLEIRVPATLARNASSVAVTISPPAAFNKTGLSDAARFLSDALDIMMFSESGSEMHVHNLSAPIMIRMIANASALAGTRQEAACVYFDSLSSQWTSSGVAVVAFNKTSGELQCSTTHLSVFVAVSTAAAVILLSGNVGGAEGSKTALAVVGAVVGVGCVAAAGLVVRNRCRTQAQHQRTSSMWWGGAAASTEPTVGEELPAAAGSQKPPEALFPRWFVVPANTTSAVGATAASQASPARPPTQSSAGSPLKHINGDSSIMVLSSPAWSSPCRSTDAAQMQFLARVAATRYDSDDEKVDESDVSSEETESEETESEETESEAMDSEDSSWGSGAVKKSKPQRLCESATVPTTRHRDATGGSAVRASLAHTAVAGRFGRSAGSPPRLSPSSLAPRSTVTAVPRSKPQVHSLSVSAVASTSSANHKPVEVPSASTPIPHALRRLGATALLKSPAAPIPLPTHSRFRATYSGAPSCKGPDTRQPIRPDEHNLVPDFDIDVD